MADSLHASLLRAQGYQVGRWYITPFLAPFDREIYESKLILFMPPPPNFLVGSYHFYLI